MARRRPFRSYGVLLTILALFVAWPTARPARAAPDSPPLPFLVKDVNSVPVSSMPRQWPEPLAAMDGRVYFVAGDPQAGRELWSSDGTSTGTIRLLDIYPGSQSSDPRWLTVVSNPSSGRLTLFFSASDLDHGEELWLTDGTAAGTRLVRDIAAGSNSSNPRGLVAVGGTLFLSVRNSSSQVELWKSDGTASGTQRVTGNTWSTSTSPTDMTAVGNLLFFTQPGYPSTLWRSDGTASGTYSLPAQPIWSYGITRGAAFQGKLFFCDEGPEGRELWSSDGTVAGTRLLRDIAAGPDSSEPRSFTERDGVLYFSAWTPGAGYELWRTDGTAAGTTLVKDIWPGAGSSDPNDLSAGSGWLFFSANHPAYGRELWKSDGTAAGTVLVKDIMPGSTGSAPADTLVTTALSVPPNPAPPRVYFTAAAEGDQELWVSDGTPAGTVRVKDISPGMASSEPDGLVAVYSQPLQSAYPTLYFGADDGLHGHELWRSDGSAANTQLIKDLTPFTGSAFSPPSSRSHPTRVGGRVFFDAHDGQHSSQLWQTDATASGTTEVAGNFPSGIGVYPEYLTEFQGELFFAASTSVTGGSGLWRSDGTAAGTQPVQAGGTDGAWDPHELTVAGQQLFFAAEETTAGWQLWKSDGTGPGTTRVRGFSPGTGSSSPHGLTAAGNQLYFVANDGVHAQELWKSDGTVAGTVMVANINPFGDGLLPPLVEMDGIMYFAGNDGTNGYTLWRSDGTTAGTHPVMDDTTPGLKPGQPYALTVAGHTLFFAASIAGGDASDVRLWHSDGTAAGTRLATATSPSTMGHVSVTSGLVAVGDRVFFAADRGVGDWELWVSDGADAGARLVKEINPGAAPSSPSEFSEVNGQLVFRACDAVAGCEPWISDGTAAGTRRIGDLKPGPESSDPRDWVVLGSTLLFAADDGVHGTEPWAWPLVGLYQGYLPLLRK